MLRDAVRTGHGVHDGKGQSTVDHRHQFYQQGTVAKAVGGRFCDLKRQAGLADGHALVVAAMKCHW